MLFGAEFLEPRIAPAILPPVIVSATPINDSTLVDFASFTGTVTIGSQQVTAVSSIAGLYVGESISGTGIPAGTTIQTINNPTTLTLSGAATMTGLNEALNANATSIQVTYSESMTASAADPANYVLLGPNDTPIPITSAAFANPSAAITSVSWAAGVETVTANNNFKVGESVTISGMTPAALNGTFTITSVTPTQFTYAAATNPDPGTPITAETWANGVETVTAANTFVAGQSVTISGETPPSLNGTFTVVNANATTFTYNAATNPNPSVAITAENWASGVETVYANNSFLPGETVVIAGEMGATPAITAALNGTFTIVSASATQFTYDAITNPGAPTVFGTATATTFGTVAATAFGTASAAASPDTTVELTFNTGYTITGATWTQEATDFTAASWAAGIETITADNTFTAGQTVALTGTLTGNVTVESATGTEFTYDVGANPLPVSQVDPITGTLWTPEVATITGLSWTNGVATVTAANTFQPGQAVVIANMAAQFVERDRYRHFRNCHPVHLRCGLESRSGYGIRHRKQRYRDNRCVQCIRGRPKSGALGHGPSRVQWDCDHPPRDTARVHLLPRYESRNAHGIGQRNRGGRDRSRHRRHRDHYGGQHHRGQRLRAE